jgi:formate-dependent nitrite reductase membrane component NrfD
MDPKANGQLQHEWGWQKAVYLFLGGVGAGAYMLAAVNGFVGENTELATTVGLWIGFPAVLIGTLFLLSALGSPTRAVLAARKQGSSWISRGTVVLSVFMVLAFVHLVLHRFTDVGGSVGGRMGVDIVAIAGIVFAIGTMAYTGILLGASKGIPFWRSGAVPVVFVTSALVSGQFAIMLGMTLVGEGAALAPLRTMALGAVALIILEVLAIAFFLQAAYKVPDSRESAERFLHRRLFVVGYFILGVAVPLILMLIAYRTVARTGVDSGIALVVIAALLGLAGRLILRQGLLACGAFPTLNIAGFEFRRIHRPKEPKPGIGMLPPQ